MSLDIKTYNPRTHKVVPKDAVVLDLHEANPAGDPDVVVANLLKYLRKGTSGCKGVADQIEEQTKPPRIPEPGLWGVVEAHTAGDSERRRFGRTEAVGVAVWIDTFGWHCWSDLIDPVELRPGIEDAS